MYVCAYMCVLQGHGALMEITLLSTRERRTCRQQFISLTLNIYVQDRMYSPLKMLIFPIYPENVLKHVI